jgi:hypothetical protein
MFKDRKVTEEIADYIQKMRSHGYRAKAIKTAIQNEYGVDIAPSTVYDYWSIPFSDVLQKKHDYRTRPDIRCRQSKRINNYFKKLRADAKLYRSAIIAFSRIMDHVFDTRDQLSYEQIYKRLDDLKYHTEIRNLFCLLTDELLEETEINSNTYHLKKKPI